MGDLLVCLTDLLDWSGGFVDLSDALLVWWTDLLDWSGGNFLLGTISS